MPSRRAGIAFKQAFKRLQPSWNALRVVQPIDAEHDAPATGIVPDGLDTRKHVRIRGEIGERRAIYPHREHAQLDLTAGGADAVNIHLHPPLTCSREVTK